jgi:carboxypeptidase family protein/TonB-dependent receptor-like protein
VRATILVIGIYLLNNVSGAAQETTGGLIGRIVTQDGSPLADVEIAARGPRLLGSREGISTSGGYFSLPALPAGTYSVTVRRLGYRPVRVEQVPVRLGATTSVGEIQLEIRTVEIPELVVSGERAALDPTRTASSTALDAQQLDVLPLTRNFRDIALLAPASIPSFLGRAGGIPEGINIGGATGLENSYYVDGINITDVIHGGTSLDLPYNFVQQIEIRTGGSTAEDAQALGGVVNVVTPNGGERLQGNLFGFYSADALRTEPQTVLGSTETGFRFYDVGARLGGPVLPRRLWFFAAYNRTSETREHTLQFGGLRDLRRQNLFAGKLTWQPGPRTSAALTILGDPSRSEPLDFPIFGSGVPLNPEVLQAKGKSGGVGLSLRANHFLTQDLFIEGSLAQIHRIEVSEPATPTGRTPVVIDQLNGTISGGIGFTNDIDSRRRSTSLGASWRVGPHALRLGALYEWLYMDQTIEGTRTGSGGTIGRQDTALWSWHSSIGSGQGENRMPSLFIQDVWQVAPRLVLNAGLRWSRQTVHNLSSGTVSFRVRDGVQPRLGLVYQPGRMGTQRIYGSYGRVANQIALWGVIVNGFGAETLFVFPQDPRADTTGGSTSYAISTSGGFPSDGTLRGETADEWVIGYGRQLTGRLELSVRAVRRAHRDAVQVGSDTLGSQLWGNLGRGALAHFPHPRRTYQALEFSLERAAGPRSPWVKVSYVLSRTYGNYPGLYGSDWRLDFAHFGPMYFVPEQQLNGTGLLPNDRTHLLKLFGSQRFGSHLVLGASFLLASGTPRSEYGAIPGFPPPFRGLSRQRGTVGRTPTIWDLGIRGSYEVPVPLGSGTRARLLVDIEHVGSPQTPVDYDQIRFTCLDSSGNQACPNAGYGRVIQYQPPMTARIGLEAGF